MVDNTLAYEEFAKAVRDLNNTVTERATTDIFNGLDRHNQRKVSLGEIEGLFKNFQRINNPMINLDDVIYNVLSAFNGDHRFIHD